MFFAEFIFYLLKNSAILSQPHLALFGDDQTMWVPTWQLSGYVRHICGAHITERLPPWYSKWPLLMTALLFEVIFSTNRMAHFHNPKQKSGFAGLGESL